MAHLEDTELVETAGVPVPEADLPGSIVAGRYRLARKLGQGGMGSVWQAENLSVGGSVAVKLMSPAIAGDRSAVDRFLREAKAAAALRSPHVVQTFDHGMHGDIPYIAMEMLDGEALSSVIAREGKLAPQRTVRVMTQICRAVQRAHDAGIIHRDLKPDNVFLVANEDEEIAKVLDFGIAKATDEAPLSSLGAGTATGALLGTPFYMSPEQAQGVKQIDWRSDLWALGVITFECLCGRRPFESTALGDLLLKICTQDLPVPSSHAEVPPAFDAWFARATARDPDGRFQSARDLADALRDALDPDGATRSGKGVEFEGRPTEPSSPPVTTPSAVDAFGSTTAATSGDARADEGPKGRSVWMFVAGAAVLVGTVAFLARSRAPGDDLAAATEPSAFVGVQASASTSAKATSVVPDAAPASSVTISPAVTATAEASAGAPKALPPSRPAARSARRLAPAPAPAPAKPAPESDFNPLKQRR